jgi:hypothetical protein
MIRKFRRFAETQRHGLVCWRRDTVAALSRLRHVRRMWSAREMLKLPVRPLRPVRNYKFRFALCGPICWERRGKEKRSRHEIMPRPVTSQFLTDTDLFAGEMESYQHRYLELFRKLLNIWTRSHSTRMSAQLCHAKSKFGESCWPNFLHEQHFHYPPYNMQLRCKQIRKKANQFSLRFGV